MPPQETRKVIETLCGPYINAMHGFDNAVFKYQMFRGIKNFEWRQEGDHEEYRITTVNQQRVSRDTRTSIHKMFDDWFDRNTGYRFRSAALFTIGNEPAAYRYAESSGEVVNVIPAGEFHYCWSPKVKDLLPMWESNGSPHTPEMIDDFMNAMDYKVDQGLPQAIRSGGEIMIACKKAVLLNQCWVFEENPFIPK